MTLSSPLWMDSGYKKDRKRRKPRQESESLRCLRTCRYQICNSLIEAPNTPSHGVDFRIGRRPEPSVSSRGELPIPCPLRRFGDSSTSDRNSFCSSDSNRMLTGRRLWIRRPSPSERSFTGLSSKHGIASCIMRQALAVCESQNSRRL